MAKWLSPAIPPDLNEEKDVKRHSVRKNSYNTNQRSGYLEGRTANIGGVACVLEKSISSNRCYDTFRCLRQNKQPLIAKLSHSGIGDRLLIKEYGLLGYLSEQGAGSTYTNYLPQKVAMGRVDGRSATLFVAQQENWYTVNQIRKRFPRGLDGEHIAWMFNRMLEAVGFVHRHGTIHTALLPQHVVFDSESHGMLLTDWTHAKEDGKLSLIHI